MREDDTVKPKRDGYSYNEMVGEVTLRPKFRVKAGGSRALKRLRWLNMISLHLVSKNQERRSSRKEAQENGGDPSAEIVRHASSGSAAGGCTVCVGGQLEFTWGVAPEEA